MFNIKVCYGNGNSAATVAIPFFFLNFDCIKYYEEIKKVKVGEATLSYSAIQPPFDIFNFPWSSGFNRKLPGEIISLPVLCAANNMVPRNI